MAPEQDLPGIRQLCWGDKTTPDIFRRWSQGFYFSQSEPTALEQSEGGPCAVIAPVQAFILKGLLLKFGDISFRDVNFVEDARTNMLAEALCEILGQCKVGKQYYVVHLVNNSDSSKGGCNSNALANMNCEPLSTTTSDAFVPNERAAASSCIGEENDRLNSPLDECCPQATLFHQNLAVHIFPNLEDVKKYYTEDSERLKSLYSILLFLYSVIATRGLELVKSDIATTPSDPLEPLIEPTFGYGSQGIINLMLTGRATIHLFDNEQDLGGMILKGLEKQSQIGFISYVEHLRHVTVGSFYKNPIHPVWVMASDTHLTVLFSTERRLVSPETKSDQARRVFRQHDPEGNNFIDPNKLPVVLEALDLVSDPQYIQFLKTRLDPENLGIILLKPFMEEFFQEEENRMPDTFTLYHYNGLPQGNSSNQIKYHEGSCILLESDLKSIWESDAMLTALQTKWPNIEVKWLNGTPSLN